jgi:hypothetical protein
MEAPQVIKLKNIFGTNNSVLDLSRRLEEYGTAAIYIITLLPSLYNSLQVFIPTDTYKVMNHK